MSMLAGVHPSGSNVLQLMRNQDNYDLKALQTLHTKKRDDDQAAL